MGKEKWIVAKPHRASCPNCGCDMKDFVCVVCSYDATKRYVVKKIDTKTGRILE